MFLGTLEDRTDYRLIIDRQMARQVLVEFNLKEAEVRELLKLEELFHCQYMTEELLNAMIGLYVKFVEQINSNQHPLRLFFMEKIKFVLSRAEVIRILEKDSVDNHKNMRETIRGVMGLSEHEEMEMKKLAEEAKKEIRKNHVIQPKKDRGLAEGVDQMELRDKERNVKIEMQMKIMEEVEVNMRKMKKDMNNEGAQRKKNQEEITNIIQVQDNALNERLARRKKKLRKRSADLKAVDVIEVEPLPPIAIDVLKEMKKELAQTYERFTRLTMNKTKRDTLSGKEGKVKVKMEEAPIYEEDIFADLDKPAKKDKPISFSKKKKAPEEVRTPQEVKVTQEVKVAEAARSPCKGEGEGGRNVDSSIEYKPFDQKLGRVTVRTKVYEQIEEDDDPFG